MFARLFDRQMSAAEMQAMCFSRNPDAKRQRRLCKSLQASYSAFLESFNSALLRACCHVLR